MSLSSHHIVNDVTGLNPVRVMAIVAPASVEDVQEALRRTTGPVSIGGGRFSMGGQTASPGSLHIDMRSMNRVIAFSPTARTIRVQAGTRWCDIQRFIDPHGLSVKIMQTYANFTVGGALSVNCHGRYVGLGPLVLSVRAIRVALHDGSVVEATRESHAEVFRGAIGGYGALGVIVEVELDLDTNQKVERQDAVMPLEDYWRYFKDQVRGNPAAVFHNADLYGPHYRTLRAVTWKETDKPATVPDRLQPLRTSYPLHRYFLWSMSETPFGKERREKLIDPLLYLRGKVHWRNYEAGYDVAELEPPTRMHRTYVLQEYFVPVERLTDFVPRMAEILRRHRVNALNISIRHAMPDPDTLMAWAPTETFAFVLYHKQRTRENARRRVAVWTRELIDAVLSVGGSYYLPYQPHATHEQFHRAYPGARALFALKQRLDPQHRFTNALWDKYCPGPTCASEAAAAPAAGSTEFHRVFGDTRLSDAFYLFLQNVFHTAPEDRFHHLIADAVARHRDEESIYRDIQRRLPSIKPAAAELRYALPALFKQKAEMTRQTLAVLPAREFDGYLEIGSKARYHGGLAKVLRLRGELVFVEEKPQSQSPVDIVERGRIARPGRHFTLDDYAPLPDAIASGSIGLVTCYIGLHHMTPETLGPFLRSVHRVMRPGGAFIVRDHDVRDADLGALVSLAHTVFNAGLGETWESNVAERRHFASGQDWVDRLRDAGFEDSGHRVLQANDPTMNTLFCFIKPAEAA